MRIGLVLLATLAAVALGSVRLRRKLRRAAGGGIRFPWAQAGQRSTTRRGATGKWPPRRGLEWRGRRGYGSRRSRLLDRNGLVVFAQDYRLGWGNVVIVRHAYLENGTRSTSTRSTDISTRSWWPKARAVKRLQQVGTIGNNRGMYDAHLHFEMRKNLQIGMHRSSYARDFSNYWDPTTSSCPLGARRRRADGFSPINTFPRLLPRLLMRAQWRKVSASPRLPAHPPRQV